MLHTINCVQNAIQCARENIRDYDASYMNDERKQRALNDSKYVYDVANSYIDESMITCVCNYEKMTLIENELRELYRFAHARNFTFKSNHVENETFHVAYSITYDDNEKQFVTMIVKFDDTKHVYKTFNNFIVMNEIEIY